MHRIFTLFSCCITLSVYSYSQNAIDNLIPKLPFPQSNTINQYSSTLPAGTMVSNGIDLNNVQQINSNNESEHRAEQGRREAMIDAYEKIDKPKRTTLDCALDTVFGHPPVVDKSTYQTTKQFWDALVVLTDMSQGKRKFSITEAIYTVENAYFNNKLSKDQFYSGIKSRAELAKQTMKREQLDPNNNLAKNYAIQKQFERANKYTSSAGKITIIPKLEYDFHDFMGDTDHTEMFVSKLMATGKGQCHSMPLMYLAIAEQLDAQAYLSIAPEHAFIKFSDGDGSMYNYETTNGSIVSDNWMMQSGYITTAAIKSKTYLDTLSQKQLLAMCINDLAIGYIYDYGLDAFTEIALKYVLPLYPNGMQGNIILSRFWEAKTKYAEQYYNIKTKEAFEKNAVTSAMYRNLQKSYDVIDALGYQKMPPQAYAAWLLTVNKEREKQDKQLLQQHLQYLMKNTKMNITTKK